MKNCILLKKEKKIQDNHSVNIILIKLDTLYSNKFFTLK